MGVLPPDLHAEPSSGLPALLCLQCSKLGNERGLLQKYEFRGRKFAELRRSLQRPTLLFPEQPRELCGIGTDDASPILQQPRELCGRNRGRRV